MGKDKKAPKQVKKMNMESDGDQEKVQESKVKIETKKAKIIIKEKKDKKLVESSEEEEEEEELIFPDDVNEFAQRNWKAKAESLKDCVKALKDSWFLSTYQVQNNLFSLSLTNAATQEIVAQFIAATENESQVISKEAAQKWNDGMKKVGVKYAIVGRVVSQARDQMAQGNRIKFELEEQKMKSQQPKLLLQVPENCRSNDKVLIKLCKKTGCANSNSNNARQIYACQNCKNQIRQLFFGNISEALNTMNPFLEVDKVGKGQSVQGNLHMKKTEVLDRLRTARAGRVEKMLEIMNKNMTITFDPNYSATVIGISLDSPNNYGNKKSATEKNQESSSMYFRIWFDQQGGIEIMPKPLAIFMDSVGLTPLMTLSAAILTLIISYGGSVQVSDRQPQKIAAGELPNQIQSKQLLTKIIGKLLV